MIDLKDFGFTSSKNYEKMPARVVAVHKGRYELVCEQGYTFGQLKSSQYYGDGGELFPTVGDFVLVDYIENSDSRIVKTLDRTSFFTRLDPSSAGQWDQAVASNFDYVFIMASLNFDFNLRRTERYLTLAWQSGATPVIVLTKSDLVEDYSEQLKALEGIAVGVDICAVSAKSGQGLEGLSKYLQKGKTIVLLGSSGVGKSSLANALAGEEIMLVNEIREDDSKGRHTTTHRQLMLLKSGVMVIDTPGMRVLGMWDVSEGLGKTFDDVEQYFGQCKFADCKHQSEPSCAIKMAIAEGTLTSERWESYNRLKKEAKYTDDKAGYLRERQQWHKGISKQVRQIKKGR